MTGVTDMIFRRIFPALVLCAVLAGCASEIAYYKRGVKYEQKGEYAKALSNYRKSVKKNPDYALSYYGMGSVFAKTKRWDNALQNLLTLLRNWVLTIRISISCWVLYTRRLMNPTLLAEEYGRAIKARPDDVLAHMQFGSSLEKTGDHEGALAEYNSAIGIALDFPEAYFHSARMLFKLKRYKDAESTYLQALEFRRIIPQAQNNLTILYLRTNQMMKAFESARKTSIWMPDTRRALRTWVLYTKRWANLKRPKTITGGR